MSARACIEHQLPGRLRLRVLERQSDEYFLEVKSTLERCDGVLEVSVRPFTASVLILHQGSIDPVLRRAAEHELFEIVDPKLEREGSALRAIYDELTRLDQKLREHTDREWGLGSLAFYGLLAATGLQVARGHLFPAASTLLYNAVRVLKEVVDAEATAQKPEAGRGR